MTQLVCVGLDRGDIPTRQGGVYEAAPRGLDRVSPSTEPRQKSTHKGQGAAGSAGEPAIMTATLYRMISLLLNFELRGSSFAQKQQADTIYHLQRSVLP